MSKFNFRFRSSTVYIKCECLSRVSDLYLLCPGRLVDVISTCPHMDCRGVSLLLLLRPELVVELKSDANAYRIPVDLYASLRGGDRAKVERILLQQRKLLAGNEVPLAEPQCVPSSIRGSVRRGEASVVSTSVGVSIDKEDEKDGS